MIDDFFCRDSDTPRGGMENGISSAGWDLCRSERICRNRHSPPPKTVHACVYTQPPGGGKARAVGRRFRAGRLPPPLSLSLSLSLSLHKPNSTPRRSLVSWAAEAGGPLLVSGAYSVGRRRTNMRGARPAAPPQSGPAVRRPVPSPPGAPPFPRPASSCLHVRWPHFLRRKPHRGRE